MAYGNIICKVNLVDFLYMDQKFLDEISKNNQEYLCGDYRIGRYAWILENVEKIDIPIPKKGHLNIWSF